jgi:hypothetical protein
MWGKRRVPRQSVLRRKLRDGRRRAWVTVGVGLEGRRR